MPSQSSQNFVEWRAANSGGKYPFAANVTLANDDVFIPNDTFIDAKLYPVGADATLHLSQIIKDGNQITVYVGTTSSQLLASGSYDSGSPSEVITLEDTSGRAAGMLLTSAQLMLPLVGWADGTYTFTQGQTGFAALVVVPVTANGVTSIRGSETTNKLSGNVWLVGGRGVVFEVDDSDPDEPVITVNAVGEPLYKRATCEETGFPRPCLLQTINNIPADEFGNFLIGICGVDSNQTVFRIEPIANGLQIRSIGRTV